MPRSRSCAISRRPDQTGGGSRAARHPHQLTRSIRDRYALAEFLRARDRRQAGAFSPDRHSTVRRHETHRAPVAARKAGGSEGAGGAGMDPLSPVGRHSARRQHDARLFRRVRHCRVPCRHSRLGQLRGPAARRISQAGTERCTRSHRLAGRPGLVQRQCRHDRHFMGRFCRSADRRAPSPCPESHHHCLLDGRPLQ